MIALLMMLMLSNEPMITGEEACLHLQDMAKTTMTARQKNITLAQLYGKLNDGGYSEWFVGTIKTIAKQAYLQPVWRTDEHKQRAIDEFANEYFLACLTSSGKDV